MSIQLSSIRHKRVGILTAAALVMVFAILAAAHPLGNFTISHYARLEIGAGKIKARYVVDMAEISTFQEFDVMDTDGDRSPSQAEKDAYLDRIARQYADNLVMTIDGARVPLRVEGKRLSLQPGDGGLPILRVECDLLGEIPAVSGGQVRRLRFEDGNGRERSGWREIVVQPAAGVGVFDSTAFGNGVTDELKAYPKDMLTSPLNERSAELSFTTALIPAGARALLTRDGRQVEVRRRDRLAELIAVPELSFKVALWGLLLAALLGAFHAMSPGHGKTVVGAYLIGSRGTARHAAFLGLTVTITHTAGVFALGVLTLAGSQYILPEKLFPALSVLSGAIVVGIGLSQVARRLRAALGFAKQGHHHHHDHSHDHDHGHHHDHHHGDNRDHGQHHHHHHDHSHGDHGDHHDHQHHDHSHDQAHGHAHSHGDHSHDHGHSHLPPERITWRSLLALGISGGLLPCPSALVVLLAAISLHRVGYGLLLTLAFSAGLAGALTAVGLLFIYARRLVDRPALANTGWLVRALPVASAVVITCVGAAICYQSLAQTGLTVAAVVGAIGLLFSIKN